MMRRPQRATRAGNGVAIRRTAHTAHKRAAFTLLEMLVVVIIIGLLAALVGPRLIENVGKTKVKTTRAQIELLSSAVQQFSLDMGREPTAEEGLDVLLRKPGGEDADRWDGPYLQKNMLPKDGWGKPFDYLIGDDHRFLIRSFGADGRPGGEDEDADLDNRNT